MRTSLVLYVTIAAAVLTLAAGYTFAELPLVAAIIFTVGALWITAEIRRWRWIGSLSFFLLVIGSAVGIVVEVDPIWAIACTVLALDAWEFGYFQRFLKRATWVRNEEILIRRHHTRVIVVSTRS